MVTGLADTPETILAASQAAASLTTILATSLATLTVSVPAALRDLQSPRHHDCRQLVVILVTSLASNLAVFPEGVLAASQAVSQAAILPAILAALLAAMLERQSLRHDDCRPPLCSTSLLLLVPRSMVATFAS